jgi:hypothetical protein
MIWWDFIDFFEKGESPFWSTLSPFGFSKRQVIYRKRVDPETKPAFFGSLVNK